MAGFRIFILVANVSTGLLSAALAVPLMRRKVGMNSLYGFRTRRTLAGPTVWYEANAFAGRCLFRSGVATSLACLALCFVPAIGPVSYAFACLLITLSGVAVGIILSFRFLNRLNP